MSLEAEETSDVSLQTPVSSPTLISSPNPVSSPTPLFSQAPVTSHVARGTFRRRGRGKFDSIGKSTR